MFLDRRVNQGSSGRVYPNRITDRLLNEQKTEREYRAVYLENEFIEVIVMPELGGKIFAARDKTNGYELFYRQHVIKPALIGLFGPWLSGGVEFNWPRHHRPSTLMPTDHCVERHQDGSVTVWLSEHDPMRRMKGMVGVCLYPGRSLIETRVRLYNRTPLPQSFLWWQNAAVHCNEDYQIVFPPDVQHVTFHSRQAMAHYPVARESFCGIDFSRGVDISWHKNTPHATSYFVTESRYPFMAGYDHGKQAGVIHVADPHIAPGKKLFTWGTGALADAWEAHLTDTDGQYCELMAGAYTDNQPDFSWLQPYETRWFSQYWYPIRQIGPPVNANRDLAVSLSVDGVTARVGIAATQAMSAARVSLRLGGRSIFEQLTNLGPAAPFVSSAVLPEGASAADLLLQVYDSDGGERIRYVPEKRGEKPLPDTAKPPPPPAELKTPQELYLTGRHVEQYLHPTLEPEAYWLEALRRDPEDAPTLHALGRLRLREGRFAEAEEYLRAALSVLTRWNPNPYDGEPFYTLGLALKFQRRWNDAYDAFYRATWCRGSQAPAYYALAEIDCRRRAWPTAMEHLERSSAADPLNLKARNLAAAVRRRNGSPAFAAELVGETLATDPLDHWARNEKLLAAAATGNADLRGAEEAWALMRGDVQTCLDLVFDYCGAALWEEAEALLTGAAEKGTATAMIRYAQAYVARLAGREEEARSYARQAMQAPVDHRFPARLEEIEVLECALELNPEDGRAACGLGNLLYDKRQYDAAVAMWERASRYRPEAATAWRNLGIAHHNRKRETAAARQCYRRALQVAPDDARLLFEYDLLLKQTGAPPAERLKGLDPRRDLVESHDVLYLELATLNNLVGRPRAALDLLEVHRFHPWEGGEAAIINQYLISHLTLGRRALAAARAEEALAHFDLAGRPPKNLGSGFWHPVSDVPRRYYLGVALADKGDGDAARACFRDIVAMGAEPWLLLMLPSLSCYQAMALRRLGEETRADALIEVFLRQKETETNAAFATSLPNILPLDEDPLTVRRRETWYLIGLARLTLGQEATALEAFEKVLALNPNHLPAAVEARFLRGGTPAAIRGRSTP
ncbi:DUF5107 domain-containing protein [Verrucomicrobiota bacterium]